MNEPEMSDSISREASPPAPVHAQGGAPGSTLAGAEAAFDDIPNCVRRHALAAPTHAALILDGQVLTYATLDRRMDEVASALQRDGFEAGDAVAICAETSLAYVSVFLGALRAGLTVVPLAPGSGADALQRMVKDARARCVFVDAATAASVAPAFSGAEGVISMDGSGKRPLAEWLHGTPLPPRAVAIQPGWIFNIIYSSGTTGTPKGIAQSHAQRWGHVGRGATYAYGPDTVTLLSTPLYSNTTLVILSPTLGRGGTAVLMRRFDASSYLELAQRHRVTHTMLVPVQYQRLLALREFDAFDLSSLRYKFSGSAPFHTELKRQVLRRWPAGGLTEFYAMTEGGGTCVLEAHLHPDKLHTVGMPAKGHDIRIIDEGGAEVPAGQAGEVVGSSASMMVGYHNQPDKTREIEWFDAQGKRFFRTGDIGRFDEEGFLILLDRKKDVLISGGFNIYPSDLEAVLLQHPAVADAAVVGVPSERWGESPVAFVATHGEAPVAAADLLGWANARLGKTQRLIDVQMCKDLPRGSLGKVLKRELRDRYQRQSPQDRQAPP